MLRIFTYIADGFAGFFGLSLETQLGSAIHFFVEDTLKIFFLLYALIFIISLFRSKLSSEKIRDYVLGKPRWLAYGLAVFLGVVTPFCSCSSIPLFIGFIAAGVPFGVAMAFLVSSPLVSEIAAVLLVGVAGPKIAVVYVVVGAMISMLAGFLTDFFGLGRFLEKDVREDLRGEKTECGCCCKKKISVFRYAHNYALGTIKDLYLYILIGIAVGAAMHGYVPQEVILKYAGSDNIWAVPFVAVLGIPLYANHVGVIPIVDALLQKGVPVGTALVALMSITAISLPEIMMLKKVLQWKLLALFTGFLLISFIVVGYLLNFIFNM